MELKLKKFKKPIPEMLVREGEKFLWPQFHPHHYMTANNPVNDSLPRSSKFFTFYWLKNGKEILIGCLGVLNQISKKGQARRITRMVVKPEFQGLGFSKIMINSIADLYLKENIPMYISTFHPRLGSMFEKSNSWEASANNMKEFKKLVDKDLTKDMSDHPFEDTLRDGVAMYRYHYIGNKDYTLDYNPLILEDLLEISKTIEDNGKEYKKIQAKIKAQQRKKDPNWKETIFAPELKITDENHIKAKEEHKRLFKKNKRKVLTSEERKEKKLLKKENTKNILCDDEW